MGRTKLVFGLATAAMLAGCNTIDTPLIFGKVDNLGIQAAITAPDQGGSLSLGYKSHKLAIVPVTAHAADGSVVVLKERRQGATVSGDGAFSTFAHFEASAATRGGIGACLGDTFATGLAAQVVAQKLERVCGRTPAQ